MGLSSHYEFTFNADYSFAEISPQQMLFGHESVLSQKLVNFTMQRQLPPVGACPPSPDATPEARSECAVWKRESKVLSAVPGVSDKIGTYVYYAFEIIDKKGARVQPYYDAYLRHANGVCTPDAEAAKNAGLQMNAIGLGLNSSFVGDSRDIHGKGNFPAGWWFP